MRTIELEEHSTYAGPVKPGREQLRALTTGPHARCIEALPSPEALWKATSYVGAVSVGDLAIVVRPKTPIDRVMFLITYAMDPRHWRRDAFDLKSAADVLEAVALAFAYRTRQAIRRGLLHAYRREEDALNTVRGRIRFGDQVAARHGMTLPIEVAFDEYTDDIEKNRLLKTAIFRLGHAYLRSEGVRREVRSLRPQFASVSRLGDYRRRHPPEVRYTRLDEHYRPAVELARLIIENSSLELLHGTVAGAAFFIDMNMVFERFLYAALGESLGLTQFQWRHEQSMALDEDGRIRMKPDMSWWTANGATSPERPVFVGDAKYKRPQAGFEHTDVYQMLAYCTGAGVARGMLVYPAGEAVPGSHVIRNAGKTIEVAPLDLRGTPEEILGEVDALAARIRDLADVARVFG